MLEKDEDEDDDEEEEEEEEKEDDDDDEDEEGRRRQPKKMGPKVIGGVVAGACLGEEARATRWAGVQKVLKCVMQQAWRWRWWRSQSAEGFDGTLVWLFGSGFGVQAQAGWVYGAAD